MTQFRRSRSTSRRITAATVGLGAVGLCAALAAQPTRVEAPGPAPGSLFLQPERIPLEDGSLAHAERGLLFAPVNRSAPESGVLSVEFYRFPAKQGVAGDQPPIFVLNGGPGFPGLAPRLEDLGFYESDILPRTALADVVVVGQRGIGSSRPNTICENAAFPFQMGQKCRAYWEEQGLDLAGFTVLEAAADVRDLAAALGYGKIVLMGQSFGSHWSMAVLRRHPEIVARALLSGLEGPDHTYDSPSGLLHSFEKMAASAEESPRLEGHIPEGGLLAGFRRALDTLRKAPAKGSWADPESGETFEEQFLLPQVQRMLFGLTASAGRRSGVVSWPADLIAIANGDWSRATRVRVQERRERDAARQSGDRPPPRYRTASFFQLDCGSGISQARLEALNADPAIAMLGNPSGFYQGACGAWPADLGEEFRTNFDTAIPTLIVHGDWDLSTPYDNAVELAPHFRNSRFVTVVGGTHGALREAMEEADGFRDGVFGFLATGDFEAIPERVVLPEIEWEVP